jgi:hypothetical protein
MRPLPDSHPSPLLPPWVKAPYPPPQQQRPQTPPQVAAALPSSTTAWLPKRDRMPDGNPVHDALHAAHGMQQMDKARSRSGNSSALGGRYVHA